MWVNLDLRNNVPQIIIYNNEKSTIQLASVGLAPAHPNYLVNYKVELSMFLMLHEFY